MTLLLASSYELPDCDVPVDLIVKTFHHPRSAAQPYLELSQDLMEVGQRYSSGKFIRTMIKHSDLRMAEGEMLLKDNGTMNWLKNTSFHFAVVDASLPPYLLVPYKLGLPYAIVTHECNHLATRVPYLPSYLPHMALPFTDRMSFLQRFINLIFQSLLVINTPDSLSDLVSTYVPARETIPLDVLEGRAALCMPIREGVFDFVRPTIPTVVPIGHVIIRDGSPLPPDLEEFFVGSPDGVIVVSFGSWTAILPEAVISKLMEAFSNIDMRIVWKPHGHHQAHTWPQNVRVVEKLKLNDLLAHYKTRLFISDCGLVNVIEAVSNGVPIVGVPIALDQPSNCAVVKSRGFGEVLPFASFTPSQMVAAVTMVLTHDTYSENVGSAALVTHEITTECQASGAFWVEHVMLHGSRHLRSAASDLTWSQFYCLDLIIFLTIFMTLGTLFSIIALYLCIKFGIRKFTDEMALKQDSTVKSRSNFKQD